MGGEAEEQLAVLFESGVQHLGLTPTEVAAAPGFVVDMLRSIPPAWDDLRFVTGYPGRHAVLARRSGTTWFVAGHEPSRAQREWLGQPG